MSDSQGVVRVNVSVPRDVKARMDAAAGAVNWSAVATEAFRARLLELESQRETKTMDEVIARMKAAKVLDETKDYQDGHAAGQAWARDKARPKQLEELEEVVSDPSEAGDGVAGPLSLWSNGLNAGIGEGLFSCIMGRREPGRAPAQAVACFWEGVLGDDRDRIDEWDFALGFIEGALEVWDAVKDHI